MQVRKNLNKLLFSEKKCLQNIKYITIHNCKQKKGYKIIFTSQIGGVGRAANRIKGSEKWMGGVLKSKTAAEPIVSMVSSLVTSEK